MDKTFEAPRGRLLPTLVVFVFIVGLLYSLFLVFEKISLNSSISTIEESKSELQIKIDTLKSDQIAELYNAQQLKDKLKDNTVYWSKVLNSLSGLTPVGVFLSTYSANEDLSIQVSGLADSFASVSDFITALGKANDFESAFVPSVTAGVTSDGQDVVSFSLNVFTKL